MTAREPKGAVLKVQLPGEAEAVAVWPDRESAERHGAESGLVIHKEGEVDR